MSRTENSLIEYLIDSVEILREVKKSLKYNFEDSQRISKVQENIYMFAAEAKLKNTEVM